MITDEALEIVRQTESCWIVFSSVSGEVLEVVGESPDTSARDRFLHLGNLSNFSQPVMTRYFKSATVTREVLEREQEEAKRVLTWSETLITWHRAAVEQLLQILESRYSAHPLIPEHGTAILVDHLWELHRNELELTTRERLAALLSNGVLSDEAERKLRIYLAALHGDEEHLKAIWTKKTPGRKSWGDAFALMEGFAHVRSKDHEVIDDMINVFDMNTMFGCKFKAMISLGKIGPIAGQRAADTIRATVYDSEPWIIARRDRVLERLESKDQEWAVCGDCCYGRVHSAASHGAQPCPKCLELGYRAAV
jgi:hypothetical protein